MKFFEGYVVLNANSKVAKLPKAYTQLGIEDVEAYANGRRIISISNHVRRI